MWVVVAVVYYLLKLSILAVTLWITLFQINCSNLEFGQEEVISLAPGSPCCKGGFLSVNIKTYLSVSHTYKSLTVCCCTEMYFRLSGGWNWLFQSGRNVFFTLAGTSSNLSSGWFKYLQKSASDKIWHKDLIQLFMRSAINENAWTGVMRVKGLN